jgi:hypothetical protein
MAARAWLFDLDGLGFLNYFLLDTRPTPERYSLRSTT